MLVQSAITAGAVGAPTFGSWSGGSGGNRTTLPITGAAGGTTFPNDVAATITDGNGNITNNLLMIDSAP
jgi:hypothetical protein